MKNKGVVIFYRLSCTGLLFRSKQPDHETNTAIIVYLENHHNSIHRSID